MKKNLNKRRGLYKIFHISIMTMLVLNMSMMGLTFDVKTSMADDVDPAPTVVTDCIAGELQSCIDNDGYQGDEANDIN